jgi:hypothetical protein
MERPSHDRRAVALPASTPWPLVGAVGLGMLFAGMVTSPAVSTVGAVLAVVGLVGWFREVFPHDVHVEVPVSDVPPEPVTTMHPGVAAFAGATVDVPRALLPVAFYPVSAGVKGGLAGGVAMALLATLYGVLSRHGIWYPINLLSAGFFSPAMTESTEQLMRFQPAMFAIAVGVHGFTSLVVGVLYGAMLPMLPRRPVLLGGVIAPLIWSGLLYGILGIVNPVMNSRVDWLWFVLSQFGFGLVAGVVVSRQQRVSTALPLSMRAGIEASGREHSP